MAQTKATLDKAAKVVSPEDLSDLESLEGEFEERIEKCYNDGRTYMMSQYVRMLAGIKSEKKRIAARFDREVMAAHRKGIDSLKPKKGADDSGS